MSNKFRYVFRSNLLCDYQEDILDSDMHSTFSEAVESSIEYNGEVLTGSIELIKEYLGNFGEVIDSSAAIYDADSETLESYFCDGSKVPHKFHRAVFKKITNP